MSRKTLLWLAVGLFGAMLIAAGGVYWAACAVPDFYEEADVKNLTPEERRQQADAFLTQTNALIEDMKSSGSWSKEFDSVQINSWFVEEFDQPTTDWRPDGVSQPRVSLKSKTIQVGFKYDAPGWDGVISLELIPEVRSPHEVALEIQSVRAGLMKVPANDVLQEVGEQIDPGENWDLTWEQSGANPVAVLTYTGPADEAPTLETIEVNDGKILISGQGAGKQSTN